MMSSCRVPLNRSLLPVLIAAAAAMAGCTSGSLEGGPDMAYLTTSLNGTDLSIRSGDTLLPLTPGNQWQMRSLCAGVLSKDTLTVVGNVTPPGGIPSVEIDAARDGKPWRKEFYSSEGNKGLYLAAIQDETSPLMVLNAPAPLVKYPLHEGDEISWQGTARVGPGIPFPTAIVSRLSGAEPATTPAGRFKLFRIDTIMTLTIGSREIRFPSVRWLAPNVGFVRRSFADKGRPAVSELTRFNVR